MNEFCKLDTTAYFKYEEMEYFAASFESLDDLAKWLNSNDQVVFIRRRESSEISRTSTQLYESLILGYKRDKNDG